MTEITKTHSFTKEEIQTIKEALKHQKNFYKTGIAYSPMADDVVSEKDLQCRKIDIVLQKLDKQK